MTVKRSWDRHDSGGAAVSTMVSAKRPRQDNTLPDDLNGAPTCFACAQGAPTFFCGMNCTSPDHSDDEPPSAARDTCKGDGLWPLDTYMNAVNPSRTQVFPSPAISDFESGSEFPFWLQPCSADTVPGSFAARQDSDVALLGSPCYYSCPMATSCSDSSHFWGQHSYQSQDYYAQAGHGSLSRTSTYEYGEAPTYPYQINAPTPPGAFNRAAPTSSVTQCRYAARIGADRMVTITHDLASMERSLALQTRQQLEALEY